MSSSYNAQDVLGHYPLNQHPYIGGQNALEKELVASFKILGLTDCPTEQEYEMPVLVEADSSIKFVKDFDTININKNKCAFEIGRKLVPNLKRWIAANIDGKFYPAITKIKIAPYFLTNSKENPKENIIRKYIKSIRPNFCTTRCSITLNTTYKKIYILIEKQVNYYA